MKLRMYGDACLLVQPFVAYRAVPKYDYKGQNPL